MTRTGRPSRPGRVAGWIRVGVVTAAALVLAAVPAGATVAAGPAPEPPPVRVGPPAGRAPGPAPGLRSPPRCTPPAADAPADGVDAGAARVQLPDLHRLATGKGLLIAVVDTGVSPHPLFGNRLRGGGDFLTGGDGLDDCDGHGTAVAGLLAATGVGIAPAAEVLSIRQSSPSFDVPAAGGGRRPAGDLGTLSEAIVLAVRAGADVVNVSEAVCLPPGVAAEQGAGLHAALRFAVESDVVVVAAAGNVGSGGCANQGNGQVSLPGWFDGELLTVAAAGPDDAPAAFTVPGPWVDVGAPGTGLRSLAVGGGTTTSGTDGTSFAVPWVSGLAALVRERFPDLTAREVADRILATARRPAGGENDVLGHGVIDPIGALTAVPDVLTPAPDGSVATATLPGTVARPPAPGTGWPVDLTAAGVLLLAGALAGRRLHRRPTRDGRTDRG